jgi:hypothetical protein
VFGVPIKKSLIEGSEGVGACTFDFISDLLPRSFDHVTANPKKSKK